MNVQNYKGKSGKRYKDTKVQKYKGTKPERYKVNGTQIKRD